MTFSDILAAVRYALGVKVEPEIVTCTYSSGATTATGTLTTPVDATYAQLDWEGETFTGGGVPISHANMSRVTAFDGTTITVARTRGTDGNGNNITGSVAFRVVERRS